MLTCVKHVAGLFFRAFVPLRAAPCIPHPHYMSHVLPCPSLYVRCRVVRRAACAAARIASSLNCKSTLPLQTQCTFATLAADCDLQIMI